MSAVTSIKRHLYLLLEGWAAALLPKVTVECELTPAQQQQPTLFLFESHSLVDSSLLKRYLKSQQVTLPDWIYRPIDISMQPMSYCLPISLPKTFYNQLHGRGEFNPTFENTLKQIFHNNSHPTWQLVPVVCLFSRAPDRLVPTWLDRTFGSSSAPGYLRKLLQLLRYRNDTHLFIGKPLDPNSITQILADNSEALKWQRLRKYCRRAIHAIRRSATGPLQKWKSRIIELTLRDDRLNHTMKLLSKRENSTIEELQDKARHYLYEIAAEYSVPHTGFLGWCLQRLHNIWYDALHIDLAGLQQLRSVTQSGELLVLLPNHRSHMDYLIISKIFFAHGMHPPHIAAGINLSFWPVGYFFRRAGAYFIRRKIQNDLLYARVLECYIHRLLIEGYHQEFFIEGGRSRDGKLLTAKLGILGITVDTFLSNPEKDLHYVPISLNYDKVLEDASFAAEMSGARKVHESFLGVVRSFKKISHRFGSVYVQFGQPLSLKQLCQDLGVVANKAKRRDLIQSLTTHINQQINKNMTVTATGLVAMAFLAHRHDALTPQDVERDVLRLLNILIDKPIPLAPALKSPSQAVQKTIGMLYRFQLLKRLTPSREREYTLPTNQRLLLAYYKNSILHHLLPESLLLLALHTESGSVRRDELLQRLQWLMQLVKREFVDLQDPQMNAAVLLNQAQSWFIQHGMLRYEADHFTSVHLHSSEIYRLLRASIIPYFEALFTVVDYLLLQPEHNIEIDDATAERLQRHWQLLLRQGINQQHESGTATLLMQAMATITALLKQHETASTQRSWLQSQAQALRELLAAPPRSSATSTATSPLQHRATFPSTTITI